MNRNTRAMFLTAINHLRASTEMQIYLNLEQDLSHDATAYENSRPKLEERYLDLRIKNPEPVTGKFFWIYDRLIVPRCLVILAVFALKKLTHSGLVLWIVLSFALVLLAGADIVFRQQLHGYGVMLACGAAALFVIVDGAVNLYQTSGETYVIWGVALKMYDVTDKLLLWYQHWATGARIDEATFRGLPHHEVINFDDAINKERSESRERRRGRREQQQSLERGVVHADASVVHGDVVHVGVVVNGSVSGNVENVVMNVERMV